MAGIGFVLRKLYREDNLSGMVRAGFHSTFAAAGPWLFTIIALAIISWFGKELVALPELIDFRVILIYNFSFSLVLAGPVFMIATRFLADSIHRRDISPAPGMMLGALMLLWTAELLLITPFYFLYASLPSALAVSAIVNFLLISGVWLVAVFISALKDYNRVTLAFLIGMSVAVAACTLLGKSFGAIGLLNGFSIGVSVILALLIAAVLTEYPFPAERPLSFLPYFRDYWEIALGGLIYNIAIWVDKWILWLAPEATSLANGLVTYPYYDSAMFLAYLATVPSLALFLFHTETHFFEHHARFYRDIQTKAPYFKIEKNHQALLQGMFTNFSYLFLLQATITLIGVLMAPEIIEWLGGNYLQIGMLRFGLAGSLFHVLMLFMLIVLSYFDYRRGVLMIQAGFLLLNGLLTWISMELGFQYYGYGYFLSCFITFLLASVIAVRFVQELPYHAFISTNAGLRSA